MPDLLNWLWQGSVIALGTAVVLRVLSRSRSSDRFVLCWIAMLSVLTLPVMARVWGDASPGPGGVSAGGPVVSIPAGWWTSGALVAIGLFAWTAVQTVRAVGAVIGIRCARRACRPVPPPVASRLRYWNTVRGHGRTCGLHVSDVVQSAAVLGCGSPMIVVSPALVAHLGIDELDRIIIHEWAHVQRRDDLTSIAQLAARAIAGWHPAVWWLNRQLVVERESSCDETAVSITGCSKRYAACLTTVASLSPSRAVPLPTLGALSTPGLRTRVIRVLAHRRLIAPRRSTGAVITAAVALYALSVTIAGFTLVEPAELEAQRHPIQAASAIVRNGPQASASAQSLSGLPVPPARTGRAGEGESARPESGSQHGNPSNRPSPPPIHSIVSSGSDAVRATARPVAFDPIPGLDARPALALIPAGITAPAHTVDASRDAGLPLAALGVRPMSPLKLAAEAGTSVGRASRNTAVVTAGVFSRFGKKIAASF